MDSTDPLLNKNDGQIDLVEVTVTSPILLSGDEVKKQEQKSPSHHPFVNQHQIGLNQAHPLMDFTSLTELIGTTHEFLLQMNRTSTPCSPKFDIKRVNTSGELEVPECPYGQGNPDVLMCTSGQRMCSCVCCCPQSSSSRIMSFYNNNNLNQEQKLSFMDKPKSWFGLCCGKKEDRVVYIYIPERKDEQLGWIKFKKDFTNGAEIFDAISNELLTLTQVKDATITPVPLYGFRVMNSHGIQIASAEGMTGTRFVGRGVGKGAEPSWTNFKLVVSPDVVTSTNTRAILLVAFTVWAITYQEKNTREDITNFLRGVAFFIVFSLLALILYNYCKFIDCT